MTITPGQYVSYTGAKFWYIGRDEKGDAVLQHLKIKGTLTVKHTELAPWVEPPVPKMASVFAGFVVLFKNGSTEYWKYNPAFLTPQQRAALNVVGFDSFTMTIEEGKGMQIQDVSHENIKC